MKNLMKLFAVGLLALPLAAAFSTTAKAEDNGLIDYLNQQTRQQIEAHKAQQRSGVNFGTRG